MLEKVLFKPSDIKLSQVKVSAGIFLKKSKSYTQPKLQFFRLILSEFLEKFLEKYHRLGQI